MRRVGKLLRPFSKTIWLNYYTFVSSDFLLDIPAFNHHFLLDENQEIWNSPLKMRNEKIKFYLRISIIFCF